MDIGRSKYEEREAMAKFILIGEFSSDPPLKVLLYLGSKETGL